VINYAILYAGAGGSVMKCCSLNPFWVSGIRNEVWRDNDESEWLRQKPAPVQLHFTYQSSLL